MSFEGYYRCLCRNGHYYTSDVYGPEATCPKCGMKERSLEVLVDQTNGDDYEEQARGIRRIMEDAFQCGFARASELSLSKSHNTVDATCPSESCECATCRGWGREGGGREG